VICKICGHQSSNAQKLSQHVNKEHSMSFIDYKCQYEGVVLHKCAFDGCENKVNHSNKKYCKSCGVDRKSEIISSYRNEQKNDPVRAKQYNEKMSLAMSNIWKNRVETGEAQEIRSKIHKTISNSILKMTTEEREQRFGWMNKLSKEEKEKAVSNILEKSLFKFWQEADYNVKQEIYDRRRKAIDEALSKRDGFLYTVVEGDVVKTYILKTMKLIEEEHVNSPKSIKTSNAISKALGII
jgi:hypothetical protein